MTSSSFRSLTPRFLLVVALALAGAVAYAAAPAMKFDISSGPAERTLQQFASQSGVAVSYPSDEVRGVTTHAVRGEFQPADALALMVGGTPLVVVENKVPGAFVVRNRTAEPKNAVSPFQRPLDTGANSTAGIHDNDVYVLNPFEVTTTKDTSYGALNSNSIVRFNTPLDLVPISTDVMTAEFMRDIDVTSIDELLTNYGAGVGMSFPNPAGQVALSQPGDRNTTSGFSIRGISAGNIRLNGFVTEASNFATSTNFNIERVELIRGPQGLLYGAAGAGGTIIATTDQAQFNKKSGSVTERIDQFGSRRTLLKVNAGNKWLAGTVDILNERTRYRRLFFGGQTNGIYGQFAARLPFHTTLRADYQHTYQSLINSAGSTGVSFGGTSDPRNGAQLAYLLFTGQAGANDPATGQPFSSYGAIGNGHLSWENVFSYGGRTRWERATNDNVDVVADTVWTPWLSTNIAFNYNRLADLFGPNAGGNLSAPLKNGNPFEEWAMNYTPAQTYNNRRHKNFRAAALITRDFFQGKAKTQTSFGYDYQRQGFGGATYEYDLANPDGSLILTPGASNLGRTSAPQQWWTVPNGPIFQPPVVMTPEQILWRSPTDGKYYVKVDANPRLPQYVTPNNPLGIASMAPGVLGVNGNSLPNYDKRITSTGVYLANFTNWWDGLYTTMLGYRYTRTANHIPNTGAVTPYAGPWDVSKSNAPSYNLGIDGRITKWLRWYYDFSANYNVANDQSDFYGRSLAVSYGRGQELGLKFTPRESRISGSFDVYVNNNTNYALNAGSAVRTSINPTGINGQYLGENGAGVYVPQSYVTRGAELILNANPHSNWNVHLSATVSDGSVHSDAAYGILYNDQFHTDGKGNVTYANGAPFLVPVDPAKAKISSISTSVDPSKYIAGVPTQQLTTAMIGDPNSLYYAWQGTSVTTNGQLASSSNVYKVLKNFNDPVNGTAYTGVTGLPISDIQYAWPDPARTGGRVVVTQAGQATVGYPKYQVSLVNRYQLSSGPLKGFGAVLSLNDQWGWRNYYYSTPGAGQPVLWGQKSLGVQINLSPFYTHKFRRATWRTQVNITNLTNHYQLEILPNNGLGYTDYHRVLIRWDNQPRAFSWTNTVSF